MLSNLFGREPSVRAASARTILADPSHRLELLLLHGPYEAVENFVCLRPVGTRLHRGVPAREIRKLLEVAVNQFGERNHSRAEIIGNRDVVAAEVFPAGAEDVLVEDFEPELRALLAPLDRTGVRFLALTLVMRKDLRVDETVAEVAVEPGVEPIHHLVDARTLLQI